MNVVAWAGVAFAVSGPSFNDKPLFVHVVVVMVVMVVVVVVVVVLVVMVVRTLCATMVKQATCVGVSVLRQRQHRWLEPVLKDFDLDHVVVLLVVLLGPKIALQKSHAVQLFNGVGEPKRQSRRVPMAARYTLDHPRAAKNVTRCAEVGTTPANRRATRRAHSHAVASRETWRLRGDGPRVAKESALELSWSENP